jgi:hypothetical protein
MARCPSPPTGNRELGGRIPFRPRVATPTRVYVRDMAEQPVSLSPVDFATHVLSLASTVLIAIGKMPAPDGQPHPVDLETARHLIDVLAMLEKKTKGNLEEAETKLIQSLIYDLRVAYVDAQKAHGAK